MIVMRGGIGHNARLQIQFSKFLEGLMDVWLTDKKVLDSGDLGFRIDIVPE